MMISSNKFTGPRFTVPSRMIFTTTGSSLKKVVFLLLVFISACIIVPMTLKSHGVSTITEEECIERFKLTVPVTEARVISMQSLIEAPQLNLSDLAFKLSQVTQSLQQAELKRIPPPTNSITTLHQIISQLYPTSTPNLFERTKSNETISSSVCPEFYTNRTFGKPLYITGWVMQSCNNVPPLSKVVSIAINPSFPNQKNCSQYLQWILKGVNEFYPNITVYIAKNLNCNNMKFVNSSNMRWVDIPILAPAGTIWANLLNSIITPYVLVARNTFHFTNMSSLERQIRVIESDRKIMVVGGASRNLSGHWSVGCFQTTMKNYILEYIEGYHRSKNECMFCDYISSPFVVRTAIFKQIQLNASLQEEMLFRDFFLQLKVKELLTMNCPDVMYFANDIDRNFMTLKSSWIPLIQKWKLNRVLLPGTIKHSFSCEDSGISCKGRDTISKYYLLPPCCIDQYAQTLKALQDLGFPYELYAGAVLGAVKMRGAIPWDLDIDLYFLKADYKRWNASNEKLLRSNIKFEDHGYYFIARTPEAKIDMDFLEQLSYMVVIPEELRNIPTLVEFNGEWLMGPGSPGLHARSLYGIDILKHAQSYLHTGKTAMYDLYVTGVFLTCPHKEHHACIDHFETDGNIQFMVP